MTAAGNLRHALAALALAALAGCATGPNANPKDPLEPFNREVFRINEDFDKGVLRPVAQLYADYTPTPFQRAVENFFSNVSDVYSAVNNLLQGKPTRAVEDTMRVTINSVLGIGGLIDIATPAGLPKYKEDFGQTLGVWGAPPGPYLVLPLFGPSSVRDTAGMLVDRQMDPSAYFDPVSLRNSLIGVRIVSSRAQLLGVTNLLEEAALDKYAFMRDAYLQRREYQVYDGNPPSRKEDESEPEGAPAQPEGQPGKPAAPSGETPPKSQPGDQQENQQENQQKNQPESQSLPVPPAPQSIQKLVPGGLRIR